VDLQTPTYAAPMSGKILNTLRAACEASEKSWGELAEDTGIDKSQLWRFVNGQTELGVSKCEALAKCLGLKITITRSGRGGGRKKS
jgi:transcriptional regulator with XRE-family HTH domain